MLRLHLWTKRTLGARGSSIRLPVASVEAILARLEATKADRDRWRGEVHFLRRLVSWLCQSDEINITVGSESGWVTINNEERHIPAKLEKALVVALDAAEGEDGP